MSTLRPLVDPPGPRSAPTTPVLVVSTPTPSAPYSAARPAGHWSASRRKRLFDVVIALSLLGLLALPLLAILLLIRLTSRGPAIFRQNRVGRGGKLFTIYKLRTMVVDAPSSNLGLTRQGDDRITWFGAWLRKIKADELPQFYNVLRGDMSVVGPRPKLPQYADEITLIYRPGITGAASLAFRHEEKLLAKVPRRHVESFYNQRIKPLKASIDARYMLRATLASDVRIILTTILRSFRLDETTPDRRTNAYLEELTNSSLFEMAE